MSLAGDARFLSWGLHLEPSESKSRVRYLLFFDIRNHKLLLINCDNQQLSSYDFSCIANSQSSTNNNNTLVILNLSNRKQCYTVHLYLDSTFDRDCCNALLTSIVKRSILSIASKYGTSAQLEIGCQIQIITIKHPKNHITDWQPRVLSLIQNRLLLFRDKSTDYHPLSMISLNTYDFSCYNVECYDHTIQIHSYNKIYQLHLGDKSSFLILANKLKSALTLYNKSALDRFHPNKSPPNKIKNTNNNSNTNSNSNNSSDNRAVKENNKSPQEAVFKAHEYMQSDTDDNDTDTESINNNNNNLTVESSNNINNIKDKLSPIIIEDINNNDSIIRHNGNISHFSNQSECKLEQPTSPTSDALEMDNIVKNIAPKLLEQSSPISIIDHDGNEVLTLQRDKSRNIHINNNNNNNADILRTQSVKVKTHGSINNNIAETHTSTKKDKHSHKKKKKKNKKHKDSVQSDRSVRSDSHSGRGRAKSKSKSKSKSKRTHSPSKSGSKSRNSNHDDEHKHKRKRKKSKNKKEKKYKHSHTRKDRSASYYMKSLPKLPAKTCIKSKSGNNIYDEKEEEKKEISELPMAMPSLQNHSKSAPNNMIEITSNNQQPLSMEKSKRSMSLLQSTTVNNNNNNIPNDDTWRYTNRANRPHSTRYAYNQLQVNNGNGNNMRGSHQYNRSKSIGNVNGRNEQRYNYNNNNNQNNKAGYYYKNNGYTYQPQYQTLGSPISPNQWNNSNNNKYFNFPNVSISTVSKSNISVPVTPPTSKEVKDDINDVDSAFADMRLKAPRWDTPFQLNNKTRLCTLIWGSANPVSMFPHYKYPIIPWNSDNLSRKQVYNVSAAKEGYHCLGIGTNDWCFVWGKAKHCGVLGLGTNALETTPFLIRSLRKKRVRQTCCSSLHSLCITSNNVVYGWGNKRLTGLSKDTNIPTILTFLNNKGLKNLACCNTHSLAWNPNKSIHIYSWGMCGPWLGYDNDNTYPQHKITFGLIKFDHYIYSNNKHTIASADCCSQFTLILLNTGYVGCCGINEHGRMGIGKPVIATSKVIWSSSANLNKIVRVSAGSFHSGFIDAYGKVYTCGVGNDYRLGHGDTETLFKPKMIECLDNVKAREIACVDSRTYIITTSGHLILFGKEPNSGKIHQYPFMYTHLNQYRIYNVCGSKQFAVINGIKINPNEESFLSLPNIPNLTQSDHVTINQKHNNNNKLPGIAQFVKIKKQKKNQKKNVQQIQNDTKNKNNYNHSDTKSEIIEFANPNFHQYTNPNTQNYKRNYNRLYNRNVKYYHEAPETSIQKHHYRQRTDNDNNNNNNNGNNNGNNNNNGHSQRGRERAHSEVIYADTTPKNKSESIYGKCNQAGCKCMKYVKSHSKWSKGKCKECSHQQLYHKKIVNVVSTVNNYYYEQRKPFKYK